MKRLLRLVLYHASRPGIGLAGHSDWVTGGPADMGVGKIDGWIAFINAVEPQRAEVLREVWRPIREAVVKRDDDPDEDYMRDAPEY
jgi:hypothetical protein